MAMWWPGGMRRKPEHRVQDSAPMWWPVGYRDLMNVLFSLDPAFLWFKRSGAPVAMLATWPPGLPHAPTLPMPTCTCPAMGHPFPQGIAREPSAQAWTSSHHPAPSASGLAQCSQGSGGACGEGPAAGAGAGPGPGPAPAAGPVAPAGSGAALADPAAQHAPAWPCSCLPACPRPWLAAPGQETCYRHGPSVPCLPLTFAAHAQESGCGCAAPPRCPISPCSCSCSCFGPCAWQGCFCGHLPCPCPSSAPYWCSYSFLCSF